MKKLLNKGSDIVTTDALFKDFDDDVGTKALVPQKLFVVDF